MKRYGPILLTPVLILTGCVHYADIEQVRMGMTVDQVLAMDTPCYYRGQSDDTTRYSCKFQVPYSEYSSGRTVKPYIMTFRAGILTEIAIDEQELDRQILRDRIYYDHRFYYPYGYHFHYGYGYPYW